MAENPNQPTNYDAVLGGQNPLPVDAVVLGGIESVKRRLASPNLEVRIAALSDTLKYGEAGLDLAIQTLQDESLQVKFAAYSLLKDRNEAQVKRQLKNFLPFFEFDVITVDAFGQINNRYRHYAQYFTEDLGNGVGLEMVFIPGGTFLMGSPTTEYKSWEAEQPQHQVTVNPFFIGKYPVTQAQWEVVAALPQINISLNPNPSHFQGENRPVQWVSWHESQEFCGRLAKKTRKIYRLPSEAEWEYACRAGTTTPFHFGETITTEIANYDGNYTYASASKGTYRKQTTDVGSFPPNAFGLYDMHGSVWEWCADPWHKNYNVAPSDGSVWESGGDNSHRLLRGGCWRGNPWDCRSAYRSRLWPGSGSGACGFRAVAVSSG